MRRLIGGGKALSWGKNTFGKILFTPAAGRTSLFGVLQVKSYSTDDPAWIRHAREEPKEVQLGRVAAYSTALEYSWTPKLDAAPLATKIGRPLKLYRSKDLLHLTDNQGLDVFFFTFGSFVSWGATVDQEQTILNFINEINGFQQGGGLYLKSPVKDEYSYSYGSQTFLSGNSLVLRETDNMSASKLAASFGIAQGVSVQKMENETSKSISLVEQIGEDLSREGRVRVRKEDVETQYGQLLLYMTHILLNDLLDKPDFFWDIPESEYVYDIVRDYLDLEKRVGLLNIRHEAIAKAYNIVRDHYEQRHGHRLEWIIIWLIMVEVVLGLSDFFDL